MTVPGGNSGGQDVAGALIDVVVGLGRAAAFDPARLRPALSEALTPTLAESVAQDGGERAAELSASFSTLVDALVIAAEEGVPDAMLDDVPAIDLGDRLEARKLPAELIGWVLHTWGRAVVLAEPSETTPMPTAEGPAAYWDDLPAPPMVTEAAANGSYPSARQGSYSSVQQDSYPPAQQGRFAADQLSQYQVDPAANFPAEYPIDFRTRRTQRGRSPLIALAVVLVLVVAGIGARLVLGSGSAVGDGDSTRAAQAAASPPPAPKVPALLAYRGGAETFPPDTLPAILDAADAGAGVEVDLRWTSDGVPVVMRNAKVQPPMYCAERYPVATTPWSVMSSCLTQASVSADGKSYGIARLDTTLAALAEVKGAQVYLEIKIDQTDEQDRRLLAVLKSAGMAGRTVVGSLLPAELAQLRAAATAADAAVRLMQFMPDRTLTPDAARSAGLWAVGLKQSALDAAYVGQLRAAGLKVVAWTPNSESQWAAARRAGVDYLETEKPGAYKKWAAQR